MSATRWLTPEELRAWRGYRRMSLLLGLAVTRDLQRASGLSDADYDVLSTLSSAESDIARMHTLATRMAWSISRLSHHITRMENRGLVTRCRSEGSSRDVFVQLTSQGRSAIEHAAPLHVESVRRRFLDLLTAEEVEALARITEKVVVPLDAEGT